MPTVARSRFLALACLMGFAASVHAAIPANGTLSTTKATLSFTGGPFYVPNQTDAGYTNVGSPNPVCVNPGVDCDTFELTVSLPANYATTNPSAQIVIKTSWPPVTGQGPLADACFADYLIDASGNIVNSAYTCADPEVIMAVAGQGTEHYTLEIIPELPLGQSYTTAISLTNGAPSASGGSNAASSSAAPAALPPNGKPPKPIAFVQYTAPSGMGDNAGEPSIGIDPNPNVPALKHGQTNTAGVVFFQSGPNTLRTSFDDSTLPATAKWEDVSTNLVQQAPLSDPIGFVDHQTGRIFALDLIGGEGQSSMAYSDDDGATWTPSEGGPPGGSPDHETLASGPYAPPLAGLAPIYPSAVYYCGQAFVTNFCSRSDDGGLTFGPQIPTVHPPDCVPAGAQNGHVKVGPDGTVYLPQGKCPGLIGADVAAVSVSQDNGLTWTFSAVPNSTSPALDPAVAIDAGNNAYLTWLDANYHPHVAVSKDHGGTWLHDTDMGAPFGINNANFVIATAGDAGRAAVGFIGTPTTGDSRSASAINTFRGAWHLYIAVTYDGGATWTTVDGTPHDPVQAGSVCTSGTTCGADRNLDDFNDLQIDTEGRILAGFADGCLAPNCDEGTVASGKPPYRESRTSKAAILRQACGLGLLAKYDAKLGAAPCVTALPNQVVKIPADASCHMPGVQVITGSPPATTSGGLPVGPDDLIAVYFAEPSDKPNKLIVTIKVDNLNPTPPPGYRWITYMTLPGKSDLYWLGMSTADGPTPVFNYGTKGTIDAPVASVGTFTTLGTLDGSWATDGTIQIVIDTATAPFALKAGDVIKGIAASIRRSTPSAANNVGLTTDSANGNSYTIVKNQCAGAGAKVADSGGGILGKVGALGWLTLLPLGLAGLARRRRLR